MSEMKEGADKLSSAIGALAIVIGMSLQKVEMESTNTLPSPFRMENINWQKAKDGEIIEGEIAKPKEKAKHEKWETYEKFINRVIEEPYSSAATAISTVAPPLSALPMALDQRGMPSMLDIERAKYDRPRESLSKMAEEFSRSSVTMPDDWWRQVARQQQNTQVSAWQNNMESIRTATSAASNTEVAFQNMTHALTTLFEKYMQVVDGLLKKGG